MSELESINETYKTRIQGFKDSQVGIKAEKAELDHALANGEIDETIHSQSIAALKNKFGEQAGKSKALMGAYKNFLESNIEQSPEDRDFLVEEYNEFSPEPYDPEKVEAYKEADPEAAATTFAREAASSLTFGLTDVGLRKAMISDEDIDDWQKANPKQPGEDPEDYNSRAEKALWEDYRSKQSMESPAAAAAGATTGAIAPMLIPVGTVVGAAKGALGATRGIATGVKAAKAAKETAGAAQKLRAALAAKKAAGAKTTAAEISTAATKQMRGAAQAELAQATAKAAAQKAAIEAGKKKAAEFATQKVAAKQMVEAGKKQAISSLPIIGAKAKLAQTLGTKIGIGAGTGMISGATKPAASYEDQVFNIIRSGLMGGAAGVAGGKMEVSPVHVNRAIELLLKSDLGIKTKAAAKKFVNKQVEKVKKTVAKEIIETGKEALQAEPTQ